MWKTVVYTSAVTFFLAFPEFLLGETKKNYVYWALGSVRLATLWAAIVLALSETSTKAATVLALFSVAVYAVSYIYSVVEQRIYVETYGDGPVQLTKNQRTVLWLILFIPDTNWIFDVPGWFAKKQRPSHLLIVGTNVFIALFAVYFYFIEDRFVNAYGCYPSDVNWQSFDMGLCPAFTGIIDTEKSPVCRNTFGNIRTGLGNASRCFDPKPPSPIYRDIFNHAVIISVGMYWLTAPEKYQMLLNH